MGKVKLNLENISSSQSQLGSYVVTLGVDKRPMKIPIIISSQEAANINEFVHNGFKNTNGNVKIIKNLIIALGATFEYIEVTDVVEGIFEAFMVISNVHGEIKIPTPIGEALTFITLTKYGTIYASEKVIEKVAILMDDDGYISEEDRQVNHRDRGSFKSPEDLEAELALAIASEDFEKAALIRDQIKNFS